MTQQTILYEGAFTQDIREAINENFDDLYSNYATSALINRRIVKQAPTVTILGDSNSTGYVAQSANFNTLGRQFWPTWFRQFNGPSVSMNAENFLAVEGQTATGCISEGSLAAAVALASDIYIVTFGGNDARNAEAAAQFSSSIDTICGSLLAVGGYVVLVAPLPNTLNTATEFKRMHTIKQILRDKAASEPRILFADGTKYLIDPALTTGAPASGMFYDEVHTSNQGAYWRARAINEVVSPLLVPLDNLFTDGNDLFDSDENPTGNLLTNGMLAGTAGTKQTLDNSEETNAVAGDVATSWTCTGFNGGNVGSALATCSKVTRTDRKGVWQQVVMSGTPAGNVTLNILQQSVTTNFSAGDRVVAMCDYEVDADPDGMDAVFIEIYDATDTPDKGERDGTATTGHRWPQTGGIVRGVLMTEPRTIATDPPGTVQVNIVATFGATALDATIRLGAVSLRKVIA